MYTTDNDNKIKFCLDAEGDFLELSAYAFGVSSSDWMLRIINKYNNDIHSPYQMLKFRRLPNNKFGLELDVPRNCVSGSDIVKNFIVLSCQAVDEIDSLLTMIENKMPDDEALRCEVDAIRGLYVNSELQYEMRWQ